MKYNITALKVLTDNYIWLIHDDEKAVVVDPALAHPVIDYITSHELSLKGIILTHSHADHVGGVNELTATYRPQIVDNFNGRLQDNQIVSIFGFPEFKVILTPGHLYEHVCYFVDEKYLFCGDTLFSLGCGRVFTGDYAAMHNSLNKIKVLSGEILCYPAHEYTTRNLDFTLSIDDNHAYYQPIISLIEQKLKNFGNSLPALLSDELKYNLFLRTADVQIWEKVSYKTGVEIKNDLDCFIQLRLLRNGF